MAPLGTRAETLPALHAEPQNSFKTKVNDLADCRRPPCQGVRVALICRTEWKGVLSLLVGQRSELPSNDVSMLLYANPVCGFLEGRRQVSGTGYLAPGTWYPAPEPVRRRGPNTEPDHWKTRTPVQDVRL